MLPSMPILFTRDSQDAFGNKIVTNTNVYNQILQPKSHNAEAICPKIPEVQPKSKANQIEANGKGGVSSQVKENPNKLAESVLDTAIVRSYYTKVQSRFSTYQNVPTNKFVQFHSILKSFNPAEENPVDLYRKIEQVFGIEHKDLVEEFLLFLNSSQAAQVGRFMDHFFLVQMTSFIQMLHNTFSRKPTVLKKVLRALTAGINSGSSADMKTRVLPHLHSSPRLLKKFLSLFPDERPSDSIYEMGTDKLNESFLTNDKGYDVWEFEEKNGNKRKLDVTKRLDSLYLNGRVFLQHGKMVRPARVTYPYSKEPYRSSESRLGSNHPRFLSPEPDDDRSSPKKLTKCTTKQPTKRSRKQIKLPTKHTKDVNDNTKHKDLTANLSNSPKTAKNKTQSNVNARSCRDRKDKVKEKQDSKSKQTTFFLCADELKRGNAKSKQKPETAVDAHSELKRHIAKTKHNKVEVGKPKTSEDVTNGGSKHDNGVKEPKCMKLDTSKHSGPDLIKGIKKEVESEVKSWTREEDKAILQIIKGDAGSEQMLSKISKLLPHRSVVEIRERFCQVMDLLQQMAGGQVL